CRVRRVWLIALWACCYGASCNKDESQSRSQSQGCTINLRGAWDKPGPGTIGSTGTFRFRGAATRRDPTGEKIHRTVLYGTQHFAFTPLSASDGPVTPHISPSSNATIVAQTGSTASVRANVAGHFDLDLMRNAAEIDSLGHEVVA